MLNYETKKTYTVEVTATDSTKLIDMVTVTIMVTNVNEACLTMPKELFGDLAITGPTSMDYEEGMTVAIGTYVAVGSRLPEWRTGACQATTWATSTSATWEN